MLIFSILRSAFPPLFIGLPFFTVTRLQSFLRFGLFRGRTTVEMFLIYIV